MAKPESAPAAFHPDVPETWPIVLSVEQMAAVRRLSPKKVRLLARARRLPGAYRDGRFWRFKKPAVLRWLSQDADPRERP